MLRVSVRAGSRQDSRLTPSRVWPSAKGNGVGIPDLKFRGSMAGLPVSPVNASLLTSRSATHDSGSRRFATPYLVLDFHQLSLASLCWRTPLLFRLLLDEGDLTIARRAAVRAITFMPTFDLDEEITRARFGIPAEVLPVSAQEQHLFYPELGLDLFLNADGKDVLQYLSPDDFDTHRAQLQVKKD